MWKSFPFHVEKWTESVRQVLFFISNPSLHPNPLLLLVTIIIILSHNIQRHEAVHSPKGTLRTGGSQR